MVNWLKKCGSYPINDFDGWPPLRGNDERDLVYFAVKKEHDISYKYDYWSLPLTFEEKVNKAVTNKLQSFDYHCHSYDIVKNEDGNYDILSGERKVAEAMVDGSECIIEIDEENRRFVRNTISKYYAEKYRKIFSKIRKKEYGVQYRNEEIEELTQI